jgi:hypothetical protein
MREILLGKVCKNNIYYQDKYCGAVGEFLFEQLSITLATEHERV